MNNAIELIKSRLAAVADRRYRSNGRKLRKDSILGGLPPEQQAKVDKWLFDKGMTFERVAEACGKMFGVKIGKSSVGRYFQAKSKVQTEKSKVESLKSKVGEGGVSGSVGDINSIPALAPSPQPSPPMGEREFSKEPGTVEEQYQRLLARVRKMAFLEGNLPAELRDVKFFCQLMRILIAARRERNQAVLARVERAKFEVWAAGKVLKYLRHTIDDLRVRGEEAAAAGMEIMIKRKIMTKNGTGCRFHRCRTDAA